MGDDLKYQQLSDDEQAAAIEARLLTLERDHLNASLDVEVAGEGNNTAQEQRVRHLADTITALRDRLKTLKRPASGS